MTFLFQSLLTLGLPLIALPVLIHLINLRRHRRIQWAAMEFLLESQKRNKKWILLKQMLLLLLRTAAIALIVFMLAGPVLQSQWGSFFGMGTTHHVVLLDDSYSMSDTWNQTTAIDEAKQAVGQLLDQATQQPGNQKLTLIKFSEAQELTAGSTAAVSELPLDRAKFEELTADLAELQVTETDAGPDTAIQAALGLPEPTADESRIVYLVSDFRNRQWQENRQLRQRLEQLDDKVSQLQLIQCVDQTRPNLAITRLEPEAGLRAAGVESWFQVSVANYGDRPVQSVTVEITQDDHKLPAVNIEEIPPGEQVSQRFRVLFPIAGAHQLQATLSSDAVEIDNTRYFACQVPSEFPVLVVDGSRDGDDGYYLSKALAPAGASKAGWRPQVERPSFLRNHGRLKNFSTICLLDVPRLDDSEVEALEEYVRNGGGLAIFLGPQVQRPFYNDRLFAEGEGLLPLALDVPMQLLNDRKTATTDLRVSDHPLFRVFGGQRNSFLSLVAINFFYATDPELQPGAETQVLAELRNGEPWVVSKPFGEGKVVVHLTKLSPKPTSLGEWSNFGVNPVFPVYANELAGYLSSASRGYLLEEVGAPLELFIDESKYQPEVTIKPPADSPLPQSTITPQVVDAHYVVTSERTANSGVWEIELISREGKLEKQLVAFNPPPKEGDLHHFGREQLAQELPEVAYQFAYASQRNTGDHSLAGYQLSETLLYLLLGALIVEQWLAYRTSYHQGATNK